MYARSTVAMFRRAETLIFDKFVPYLARERRIHRLILLRIAGFNETNLN